MDALQIKKEISPLKPKNVVIFVIFFLVLAWSWHSTEMGFLKLIEGLESIWIYIKGNPNIKIVVF